jgi:hypothetical protein
MPAIDCVVTIDTLNFLYLVAGPAGGGESHLQMSLVLMKLWSF